MQQSNKTTLNRVRLTHYLQSFYTGQDSVFSSSAQQKTLFTAVGEGDVEKELKSDPLVDYATQLVMVDPDPAAAPEASYGVTSLSSDGPSKKTVSSSFADHKT